MRALEIFQGSLDNLTQRVQFRGKIEVSENKAREELFPSTIDINPTADCNLDCTFCWGPDHNIEDILGLQAWRGLLDFFAEKGTSALVVTGGEPLLREDIGKLLRHAKEDLRFRVTLSTNALLLKKKANEVLPFIDEIGIPIDGSTPEKNARMRIKKSGKGHIGHLKTSLDALHFVRENTPKIEITVRTVVSKVNRDDMVEIGELLRGHREFFNRWKLYQFAPISIGAEHAEEHSISDEDFFQIGQNLIGQFPEFRIKLHPNQERVGRYCFIGPDGDIFGVDSKGNYTTVANWVETSRDELAQHITSIVDPNKNIRHGGPSNGITALWSKLTKQ